MRRCAQSRSGRTRTHCPGILCDLSKEQRPLQSPHSWIWSHQGGRETHGTHDTCPHLPRLPSLGETWGAQHVPHTGLEGVRTRQTTRQARPAPHGTYILVHNKQSFLLLFLIPHRDVCCKGKKSGVATKAAVGRREGLLYPRITENHWQLERGASRLFSSSSAWEYKTAQTDKSWLKRSFSTSIGGGESTPLFQNLCTAHGGAPDGPPTETDVNINLTADFCKT